MPSLSRTRCAAAVVAGVALGDMPRIAPKTVRRVADALSHHPLVVPVWRGQWGHPVGFGAQFFPQLRALQGARGALGVLQGNEACRCELPVEDEGVLLDVDVPDDLLRLGGDSTPGAQRA